VYILLVFLTYAYIQHFLTVLMVKMQIFWNALPYQSLTFIQRTHRILLNWHLTNAPNRQPFKCPTHSCRGLELKPHLLSPHYIVICGQIHAAATLPNYVHMHLMNTKFLASL